jgi:murein DD-endopeptidase MepM/ murein hydrolase activator NlpD
MTFLAAAIWGLTRMPAFAAEEVRNSGLTPKVRNSGLTLEVSAVRPKQGQIVLVSVRSGAPLARATLWDGEREIAMELDAGGRVFRALLGIDFESAVGRREIRVEAVGTGVEIHRASKALYVRSGRFPTQNLDVAPAYVEPPEEELPRIAADREKVSRVWAEADTARRFQKAFRLPVASRGYGSFGVRRVFNGKPRSPHDGVDLRAPQGEPVVAPAAAVVALADELYFAGGTVILDHGSGLFTTYFHLSRIDVEAGEAVGPGQRIGSVGATGRATGPHLHWGARLHRARVNPLDLLRLPEWPAIAGLGDE